MKPVLLKTSPYQLHLFALILIAITIIIIVFVIATLIHKKSELRKANESDNEIKFINEVNKKNNTKFVKDYTKTLFNEYLADFQNLENKIVAELNKKYIDEIKIILNSTQYKSLIQLNTNDFYEESIFLEELIKVSPYIWIKKYRKEIEEYYV